MVASVRRLLTLAILFICALWLFFAYMPGLRGFLPDLALTGATPWMAWLAIFALVAFVAIQLWLVYTTGRTVRAYQAKDLRAGFRLNLGLEIFWTVLPIAMTLGLAWASYPLWINLIQR